MNKIKSAAIKTLIFSFTNLCTLIARGLIEERISYGSLSVSLGNIICNVFVVFRVLGFLNCEEENTEKKIFIC